MIREYLLNERKASLFGVMVKLMESDEKKKSFCAEQSRGPYEISNNVEKKQKERYSSSAKTLPERNPLLNKQNALQMLCKCFN